MSRTMTSRSAIAEQIADLAPAAARPAAVTYRVVVSTQIYENYGAHDWDGNGECPQYWKAKGGEDYIVAEGLSEKDMLTKYAAEYVDCSKIEHNGNSYTESIIGISFVASNVETYREMMVREMIEWRCMTKEEGERWLAESRRYMRTS